MSSQTLPVASVSESANGADSQAWAVTVGPALIDDINALDGDTIDCVPYIDVVVGMTVTDRIGVYTKLLTLVNWGASLPASEVVTSIILRITHKQRASRWPGSDIKDQMIRMIGLPAPDLNSSNIADGVALPDALTQKSYGGGPVQTAWGITGVLRGSDINAAGFGFEVAYRGTPNTGLTGGLGLPVPPAPSVSIDFIEMVVTSTNPYTGAESTIVIPHYAHKNLQ